MQTATAYPRAASRSWMEINVRPWLAVTLLMAIALVVLAIHGYRTVSFERWLTVHGTPRQAIVTDMGADTRQRARDEEIRVTLQYADPASGKPMSSTGMLHRQTGAFVAKGQELAIRIHPDDPTRWTARSEPPQMLQALVVSLVMFPVVVLCLLVAWWKRARVLRTLRHGAIAEATVVSIKQTPLAPMSRQIGVTVESVGPRVRQAYWPVRNGPIAKGDVIEVVASDAMVLPARSYR